MTDRKSLDAAKQLVRRAAGPQAPSAEPFVPEIRSNIKWKPTTPAAAQALIVWHFGVPFRDIEGFHTWLAAHEANLANLCTAGTNNEVSYLGTFIHLDTGAPRYKTLWLLANDTTAEGALTQALAVNQQLMDDVKVLRGYWSRDPGATDHRYGFARDYINVTLAGLPSGGAFWDATLQSRNEHPV